MNPKVVPIAGPDLLARLQAEALELLGKLPEREPSVGDAMFVAYDRKWANENRVGPFGRMTLSDGKFMFHAAPLDISREPVYKSVDHDYFDYVNRWDSGGSMAPPIEKMLQGPPKLERIQKFKSFHQSDYEKGLFISLVASGPVTLVNPSFKTMSNAIAVVSNYFNSGIFVHVTAELNRPWGMDIRDFVQNSEGMLSLTPKIKGISYLGTGNPLYYPTTPWVRLIHSPFIDPSGDYDNYSVEYREDCFISSYEKKKGYEVRSILMRDTTCYLYNPETVDSHYKMKDGLRHFFLESSVQLDLDSRDDRQVWHSPWMIDMDDSQWSQEPRWRGLKIRVKGKIIYDIEGSGTYLSRRARSKVIGYTWKSLQKTGSHWVTYSSLKPHRDHGVKRFQIGDSDLTAFGINTLVAGVKKVEAPKKYSFVPAEDPPEGIAIWPLAPGDLSLVLTNQIPSTYYRSSRIAYMDSLSRVYALTSATNDALLFHPIVTGLHVLPFLPNGEVRFAQKFMVHGEAFVSVDERFSGCCFVFASAVSLSKMIPSLSLHSGRWFSTQALLDNAPDPQYGGQMSIETVTNKIHSDMEKIVVTTTSDCGCTAVQLAKEIGCSAQLIFHHLSRNPVYMMWKPGDVVTAQWVKLSKIHVKFEGDELKGDFFLDGRSWMSVIEELLINRKVYYFKLIPRFVSMLKWNGYAVWTVEKGPYGILKVKKPRR